METRQNLMSVGEPIPWFVANSSLNPTFHVDTTAGRYQVFCLFGSMSHPGCRRIVEDFLALQETTQIFDVENFLFTGISIDPADQAQSCLMRPDHGVRWFWDFDRSISKSMGALSGQNFADESTVGYCPHTIIIDERLRVLKVIPIGQHPEAHVQQVANFLVALPRFLPTSTAAIQAPVLVVPRVFEPELCQTLIQYYQHRGGVDSGFMRDVNGQTVGVLDYSHKRRTDCEIEDEKLRQACMVRIHDRLVPEIRKAFQFNATRMERYIVACYSSDTADHFQPHRDNTTKGTAHRRFAVSLVLNAESFEGGFLRFPEFGRQLYAPPSGGAVVFSCSLLHEATPVTRGTRFVFLPFLYDDAAAAIRQQNLQYVAASHIERK
jgi:peroxiredoxin